jgi:digeranylgeranylglycerophospholipid reductase
MFAEVNERYDAVVVGAGPAGCAVSRWIAEEGLNVLIVEEHQQVGHPNHCAGLITPRTLKTAGLPSDGFVRNTLTGALIHSRSGRELAIGGDRVHALAIDRARFDTALAQKARESGAQLVLRTRASQFQRHDDSIRVRLENEHRQEIVDTRLLIGADGANSSVARWANLPGPAEVVYALNAHVRLGHRATHFVEVFLSSDLAPGWFGWIIPLGDGEARLGIGTTQGSAARCLRELVAAFPHRFRDLELVHVSGGVIPLGLPEKIHADRLMLVGDAACQVKPTSGGGVYTGLLAARSCSRVAVRALQEDDLSAESLGRYHASWQEGMGGELQTGALLRRIFLRLEDDDFDTILHLLGKQPMTRLLARHGDIDHPSRLVTQLVRALPKLSALPMLSALVTDREDLARDVFALISSSR